MSVYCFFPQRTIESQGYLRGHIPRSRLITFGGTPLTSFLHNDRQSRSMIGKHKVAAYGQGDGQISKACRSSTNRFGRPLFLAQHVHVLQRRNLKLSRSISLMICSGQTRRVVTLYFPQILSPGETMQLPLPPIGTRSFVHHPRGVFQISEPRS